MKIAQGNMIEKEYIFDFDNCLTLDEKGKPLDWKQKYNVVFLIQNNIISNTKTFLQSLQRNQMIIDFIF